MHMRWWLVLVPAIITALASLSPVAWDYMLRFGGALYYDVKESPSISDSDGSRIGVVVVVLKNNGVFTVNNVRLIASIKSGVFAAVELPGPQFVVKDIEKSEKTVRLELKSLLRSETASVTFLVRSASFPADYQISLRSDEAAGELLVDSRGLSNVAYGAFISASVAIFLSIAFYFVNRSGGVFTSMERSTAIIFICRKYNVDVWLFFPGHDIRGIAFVDLGVTLYSEVREGRINKEVAVCILSFLYKFATHPGSNDRISAMVEILCPGFVQQVNEVARNSDLSTIPGMEAFSSDLSRLAKAAVT